MRHKTNQKAINKTVAEMLRIYEEHGPQTDADLMKRGFTQEKISTCGPVVAQMIREREMTAA